MKVDERLNMASFDKGYNKKSKVQREQELAIRWQNLQDKFYEKPKCFTAPKASQIPLPF